MNKAERVDRAACSILQNGVLVTNLGLITDAINASGVSDSTIELASVIANLALQVVNETDRLIAKEQR